MSLRRLLLSVSLTLFVSSLCFSQSNVPKTQTARQALIEMLTAPDSINKHLTEEVRTLLADPKNKQAAMYVMALKGMAGQKGIQTFEAGDTLLSYQEPRSNEKLEVHVDSDDLNGEEDNLQLSVHMSKDGKEVRQQWSSISSGFTINMKKEQNIWRLNKLSTTLEFPIGSAEFLKGLMSNKATEGAVSDGMVGFKVGAGTGETASTAAPNLSAEQVVVMLGFAEQAFARQHPETGFTCTWSDLQDSSASFGLDKQVTSGSYNGFRFALSGCEGHPAGSFRLTAEPMTGQGKAFCVDATQNVRFSEDGRGATCLLNGKVTSLGETWAVDPVSVTGKK